MNGNLNKPSEVRTRAAEHQYFLSINQKIEFPQLTRPESYYLSFICQQLGQCQFIVVRNKTPDTVIIKHLSTISSYNYIPLDVWLYFDHL